MLDCDWSSDVCSSDLYLLNTYALSKVSASTTAAYIYLQPLVTCAADYFWLGRPLQHGVLAAAALIFVGLALVLKRSRRQRASATAAKGEARS
jgi:drug/metabolite transporter (DMT)-like permease